MPGGWIWYTLPLVNVPGLEGLVAGPKYRKAASPRAVSAWECGEELIRSPKSVVAVAAHPDDLEYFAGGTLARLVRQGCRVVGVLATRGERGGRAPDLPRRRAREQAAASLRMGYAQVHILDRPDRGVQADDPELLAQLQECLDLEKPDCVFTFDPDEPFPVYLHPDHIAVARATLAVWSGHTALFHTRAPNAVVDITPHFHVKVAAFAVHRSQLPLGGTAGVRWHLRGRSYRRGPDKRRRMVEYFRVPHLSSTAGSLQIAPLPVKAELSGKVHTAQHLRVGKRTGWRLSNRGRP